jgi:hypothetical protein
MGKDKSFAAKLAKATGKGSSHCQVCGDAFSTTKVIETVKSNKKDSYNFKENFVRVCKCNVKDVIG